MKARIPIILAVGVCGLILATKSGFAQGSLTPPGPPAPTMLTLTQVEPRTPVDFVHTGSGGLSEFLITLPGSYYLTSNIFGTNGLHGINISASDVTLDLRGFTVQGTNSAYDGIYIHAGYTNVTVYNGNISGWNNASTYGNGVESYADNVTLEHLNVSANQANGILLGGSGVVRDCNVQNNGLNGINASNNCTIIGCIARGNVNEPNAGNFGGISVGNDCTVIGCTAEGNATNGIFADNNCTVKDCTANTNLTFGIVANNNCLITGNTATANGVIGIYITGARNRIDSNIAGNNGTYGIYITGAQNRVDSDVAGQNGSYGIGVQTINVDNNITRNFVPGNSLGGYYNYTGNNDYAPLQTPPSTATSPWANFQ